MQVHPPALAFPKALGRKQLAVPAKGGAGGSPEDQEEAVWHVSLFHFGLKSPESQGI